MHTSRDLARSGVVVGGDSVWHRRASQPCGAGGHRPLPAGPKLTDRAPPAQIRVRGRGTLRSPPPPRPASRGNASIRCPVWLAASASTGKRSPSARTRMQSANAEVAGAHRPSARPARAAAQRPAAARRPRRAAGAAPRARLRHSTDGCRGPAHGLAEQLPRSAPPCSARGPTPSSSVRRGKRAQGALVVVMVVGRSLGSPRVCARTPVNAGRTRPAVRAHQRAHLRSVAMAAPCESLRPLARGRSVACRVLAGEPEGLSVQDLPPPSPTR